MRRLGQPGEPLLAAGSAERHDDPRHVRRLPPVKQLTNAQIAEQLEAFAGLLDLSGSSFYTSRAYRRAAETIRETKAPIAELVAAGRVQELRGIGSGIAARLQELVSTGRIAELDELEREIQPELVGLGRFLGVNPKRMVEIGRALGVSSVEEFRDAARAGRLTSVAGIGPHTEQRLLAGLDRAAEMLGELNRIERRPSPATLHGGHRELACFCHDERDGVGSPGRLGD